jgi:hypothetical protein
MSIKIRKLPPNSGELASLRLAESYMFSNLRQTVTKQTLKTAADKKDWAPVCNSDFKIHQPFTDERNIMSEVKMGVSIKGPLTALW